ncbi:MAG: CsbD family protein, partial [Rhodococcus sp. (in: high G+C Gram-positive bacteria)]
AEAQREAAEKEAAAEKARAEAGVHEQRERAEQDK